MIAYKFLTPGRVGLFSGVRWPEPGEWLDAGAVDPCRAGIHACRVDDLPYWLLPELWRVELDGDVVAGERMVIAPRGRLVERVTGWNEQTARAFGAACAQEARRRVEASPDLEPFAADAEGTAEGSPQFAAFATARLAELQEGPAGYDAERARQARWLADALGL
jgi:hypothetical protein